MDVRKYAEFYKDCTTATIADVEERRLNVFSNSDIAKAGTAAGALWLGKNVLWYLINDTSAETLMAPIAATSFASLAYAKYLFEGRVLEVVSIKKRGKELGDSEIAELERNAKNASYATYAFNALITGGLVTINMLIGGIAAYFLYEKSRTTELRYKATVAYVSVNPPNMKLHGYGGLDGTDL